jgi:hypothetical protein
VPENVPVATVVRRRLRRLRRGVGSTKSPINIGLFMVPVERIELPTFGLQNRCSTAELNRRIEGDGVVEKKPDSAPLSRARIPDLPAKGQNLPPGPSAGGLSQAAFSVHLVLTSYWQICRRLSSPLNQMPGARSMNELSRYSYARLQPGARTQHSSSGISSVRYNLVTLPKSPFLKPRFSKAETSAFSEVSSRSPRRDICECPTCNVRRTRRHTYRV